MQVFYCQNLDADEAILTGEELRHLNVLRKNHGDTIQVCDGCGTMAQAVILRVNKTEAHLKIGLREKSDYSLPRIHLWIAPTKNQDRMEWLLEKSAEIGLHSIHFLQTDRTEKPRIKMERLEKIAISAMKQSGQSFLTRIEAPNTSEMSGKILLAHCMEAQKRNITELKDTLNSEQNIHLLIGPEGDFSPAEIEHYKSMGAIEVSLGKTRLRTETAGIYGVVLLHALLKS